MSEIWIQCPNWPNYSASNLGRIKRNLNGRIKKQTTKRDDGYVIVTFRKGKNTPAQYVHRLIALAFLGEPPTSKHEVAHWDGDKTNNNLENLRWATRKENQADRHRHGTNRNQKGEANVMARMTDHKVIEMRKERRLYTLNELSRKYKINRYTVCGICTGRYWSHIPLPPKECV